MYTPHAAVVWRPVRGIAPCDDRVARSVLKDTPLRKSENERGREIVMHRIKGTVILSALLIISIRFPTLASQTLPEQVRELIQKRLEAAGVPPVTTIGHEKIFASTMLPLFYQRRAYQPAWIGYRGPMSRASALLEEIGKAGEEGLNPEAYHTRAIISLMQRLGQEQRGNSLDYTGHLVDLDLLLTDAFLVYGAHLLSGCINPGTLDPEWHANRREADMGAILEKAIQSGNVSEALTSLLPNHPGYYNLRRALRRYRHIASRGGWPEIPLPPEMGRDERTQRVAALRKRLRAEGDLGKHPFSDSERYDENVDRAVRAFQERNGLDVDGVIGPETIATMNISAEARARQIELNLERWRWLPQDLGARHILVNIAGFDLHVMDARRVVLAMNVIVGLAYRRTPVFSAQMTYLVLNPYWDIPASIAVDDKLPLIRRNVNYLARQRIKIFQGKGPEMREIDPQTIDWHHVSAANFPFRLRQDPGPMNPLGRVKFIFPNPFNVYLHDTPSRELFSKSLRTFSSGCIRIQKPVELAEYLLRKNPEWTRERMENAFLTEAERTVVLSEPVPVHLLYWTAWVTDAGSVHFRKDIYDRDKRLGEALAKGPATPQ